MKDHWTMKRLLITDDELAVLEIIETIEEVSGYKSSDLQYNLFPIGINKGEQNGTRS